MSTGSILSLSELQMNGHPLSAFSVNFAVGGVPVAMAVPVTGSSPTGFSMDSSWINALSYGDAAVVTVNAGKDRHTLFSGHVSNVGVDASPGGLGISSTVATHIGLTHSLGKLDALAFGLREFTTDAVSRKPFHNEDAGRNYASPISTNMMSTSALRSGKPAVHVRDIVDLLVKWYQQGDESGISVKELVKAIPVTTRNLLSYSHLLEAGIEEVTFQAVNGGMAAKSTAWGILTSLASVCLLTVVPRLEDGVLVPDFPMVKFSQGLSLGAANVLSIGSRRSIPVLPTSRVCAYAIAPMKYASMSLSGPKEYSVQLEASTPSIDGYYYPKEAAESTDNILMLPIPPLLQRLMAASLMGDGSNSASGSSDGQTINGTAAKALEGADRADGIGAAPVVQSASDGLTVGEAAAKALYCKHAYSECSAAISLAPGYVLGGGLKRDLQAGARGWEDDSLYSLLGRTIAFRTPVAKPSQGDTRMVGCVTAMDLELSSAAPSASVVLHLSHVRTEAQDRKHSFDETGHPIYSTVKGQAQ